MNKIHKSNSSPHPVYSYVVTTEARDVVMFQRTIYLDGDATGGFRLSAKIDEENSSIDLSEILLEDAMSSEVPGDASNSEHVVDGFGHALGESLARRIVERTPDQSDLERAQLALACIVRSLGAPYVEETLNGILQYKFEHCPISDAGDRTGIEDIDLAHHALSTLLQTTIRAVHPDSGVNMPAGKSDEHIFSLS